MSRGRATFEAGFAFERDIGYWLISMGFIVFMNVSLPRQPHETKSTEIDILACSGFHIIVVEAKLLHELYGQSKDTEWIFVTSRKSLSKLNPILQNQRHIRRLGMYLGDKGFKDLAKLIPYNYVVVPSNCTVMSDSLYKNVYYKENFLSQMERLKKSEVSSELIELISLLPHKFDNVDEALMEL